MRFLQRYYPMLLIAAINGFATGATFLIMVRLALHLVNQSKFGYTYALPSGIILAFSAAAWWPSILLLFQQVRRPIREEAEIINAALADLNMRSKWKHPCSVKVQDDKAINAAALSRKTYVVSTGALKSLTPEEFGAVLAHEQGHLVSGDTGASAAISFSATVLAGLCIPGKWLIKKLRRSEMRRWFVLIIIAAILVVIYGSCVLVTPAILMLPLTTSLLLKIPRPLHFAVSRQTEYQQDAYAYSLGYGPALRSAFLKIISTQQVFRTSWWHMTFHRTNPITHDRIHRLDRLSEKSLQEILQAQQICFTINR